MRSVLKRHIAQQYFIVLNHCKTQNFIQLLLINIENNIDKFKFGWWDQFTKAVAA
jgi:hypothetical protein